MQPSAMTRGATPRGGSAALAVWLGILPIWRNHVAQCSDEILVFSNGSRYLRGMEHREVEAAVIGGRPAGLTAGLALSAGGVATALIAKAPPADNRTTALLSGSVAALDALEIWPLAHADAAALTAIRLVDDTRRLIRAPEVLFEAA